jgi:DNA helicase-2/ATP-dependent DNA helicase PcrA
LSAPQLEAITTDHALVCVVAGAGSGKTRVLTLRVARRAHEGSADPVRTLVCTFSRKAAEELRRRLWELDVDGVQTGTIHRTALSLLRQHRADHGRPLPVLVADRRPLLAEILDTRGTVSSTGPGTAGRGGRGPSAGQVDAEITWAKAHMLDPAAYEEVVRRTRRRTPASASRMANVYLRYEEAKGRRGELALDLDDLVWACAETLDRDHAFAAAVQWRFRHLFVDEMQDVNPAQFRMVQAMLGAEPDLFVVGDPNQSVYGWNGADPTLLRNLPELLPGIQVIRLEANHRCSPQIVAVADAALGRPADAMASTRPDGPVPAMFEHETDDEEAAAIARQILQARTVNRPWSSFAILARTNAQLEVVTDHLARCRVPYTVAGAELGPASDLRGEDASGVADRRRPGAAHGHGDRREAADAPDARGPTVTVSTFHRAKGLQWRAVFVLGLSEGLVPIASARTPSARDEERRLLYVALTRAEDELSCSWAHKRVPGDDATAPPRRPSTWWNAIRDARARLMAAQEPLEPSLVAANLAAIRDRIGERDRERSTDPGSHRQRPGVDDGPAR